MNCHRCGGYLIAEHDPTTGPEARCLLCGRTHLPATFAPLPYLGLHGEGQARASDRGRVRGGHVWRRATAEGEVIA